MSGGLAYLANLREDSTHRRCNGAEGRPRSEEFRLALEGILYGG